MQATLPPTTSLTSPGLLGTPAGELVLQICGGEHDGRQLRLGAAKCLIGSAPGCTLRLRARGVRPVHALILRGPGGALVRCWSPDAQLNERSFTEEALRTGDKLQIGPVTLTVVEIAGSIPAESSIFRGSSLEDLPVEVSANYVRPRPRSRERRRQLFEQLRREREEQTTLQVTVATQQEQLQSLELQLHQLQSMAASAPEPTFAPSPSSTNDALNQQLAHTIEQLQQELEAAANRRTLEQQTAARQRLTTEAQAEARLQQCLSATRQELQTKYEQQLAAATSEQTASLRQQLTALEQEQKNSRERLQALQDALVAKTSSEEHTRTSLAAQLEQVNAAFNLIRRERDELFEQLHADQQTLDRQQANWQSQIDEVCRSAQAQVMEAQAAAQRQLFQIRENFAARERQWDEELIARTKAEAERRATDAERMTKLTAEYETLRAEATAAAAANRQQQEGFTQARKRLEAEIATLNSRLQHNEQALHQARENSGQVQAAVLADAEQARAQRDSVREQMLRQQQDWTEFRSRLESAATAERELATARFAALEVDLTSRNETINQLQAECAALEQQGEKLKIELEQSQEALFAAESGANQRLQQMTVSMEQLQLDRGGAVAQVNQERAEWEQERNELAQCVADLQHEVTQLTGKLEVLEQAAQQATLEAAARAETSQQQLQLAQDQLGHWQAAAEQAKAQADELLQAVTRLQEQEHTWQREREQLDQLQQESTGRLQHLESAITDLQQQLDEAQRSASVTCPQTLLPPQENISCTVNVNNQELAALQEQRSEPLRPAENVGGTINIANQDLAALHEQMNEPQWNGAQPSLLAPRGLDADQLAAFQSREAALQEQADQLAAQQAQLEEEQATVARQRIELEQFQTSLVELERSLTARAEALLQQSANIAPASPEPAHELYNDSYYGEAERESNPLSESEAFRAMADQVANLYRAPAEPSDLVHTAAAEKVANLLVDHAALAIPEQPSTPEIFHSEIDERTVEESDDESLIISGPGPEGNDNSPLYGDLQPAAVDLYAANVSEPTILAPEAEEDFDRQLDARIARVMRREKTSWTEPTDAAPVQEANPSVDSAAAESSAEVAVPDQSQAVSSVLDRLREAGLWKGEGTAKADQLPSSAPPLDESGPGLCRLNEAGPIGHDEVLAETPPPSRDETDNLSQLARPRPAPASLLNPPASEQNEADDSIESYMSRLMARLKTTDVEEPRKTGNRTDSRSLRQTSAPPPPPPPPKPTDSRPLTCLTELAPRSQAPELNANLAAMRELANSAARSAIETHQQKSGKQKVNMRTINTLMALLVCSGLLYVWSRTSSYVALGGVGLSLLWAIGSSLVATLQSLKLRKAEKANEKENMETPRVE